MAEKPPELDKTPEPCQACDAMVTLGLMTSMCESTNDPSKKSKCQEILKPLEQGKVAPVKALKDAIIVLGEGDLNGTLDRMNLLLYQATQEAKNELIAAGKLNSDGTPKVEI